MIDIDPLSRMIDPEAFKDLGDMTPTERFIREPGLEARRNIAREIAKAIAGSVVEELGKALAPFATFGQAEGGSDIRDGLMRDRICDWFGPSDFDAARTAVKALLPTEAETRDSKEQEKTP